MTNFIPGTKYVRRGGGYYLYHGLTEDNQLLVETRGGIYKLHQGPGFARMFSDETDNDMLPEPYEKPIKYSKVVYLANPPCPAGNGFDLAIHLFGKQVRLWSEEPHENYPIPVRVTVERNREV